MLTLARVLRELNVVLTSQTKRVAATVATSASLRAQRHFLRNRHDEN